MPRDYAWIKLHERWYETTSHLWLSPEALNTGPRLLLGARRTWDEESDAAEIPWTLSQLATITRWPEATVQALLDELCEAGTLHLNESGKYEFPNFRKYQETSTHRVRRHRKKPDAKPAWWGEALDGVVPPKGCAPITAAHEHVKQLAGTPDFAATVADYAKAIDAKLDDAKWWGPGMFKPERWTHVVRVVAEYRRAEIVKATRLASEQREAEQREAERANAEQNRAKVAELARRTAEQLGANA